MDLQAETAKTKHKLRFGFKPDSAFGLKPGPGNAIQFGMTGRPFRLLGRPDVALTTCGRLVEDGLEWPDLRTRGCAGLVLVLDVFDSCRMTEIAKWTQDGCSCPPRVHVCGFGNSTKGFADGVRSRTAASHDTTAGRKC